MRGSGTNGGWREYWCVEEPYVYKIDDSIPWKDAALIEPLTIGEHSTSRAGVCEDDVVFILGTGTIGTIIAQACKLKGAKTVICCDISDSSLERSKQFGADYTVNSKTQDIVAEVQKITNGHGCTVAFDSACFPGSLTMIMQPGIVCNAGRVVPMGFCTVPEKITQQMINGRELTICGTRMSLNQWVPTAQKMAEGKGKGYERWAKIHNLKQAAKTLSVYQQYGFTSPEQLEAAVDTAYQEMRQTSGKLKTLETKLQGKKELQQQVLAYAKTKPARDGLKAQKSEKARAAYRQANESDFIIADAAARYFKAHGITKLPARKALQAEIEQLISEKDGLYNTYHEQKQRFKELQTVKRNIDQILRRDEPHRRKEQSHER